MNHKLILDGGMGQALLKRGMKPNGSLWSASALIDENQHNIVEETHLDFINAGCGAIITNNFTVRDRRLEDNNILEKKKYLLDIAGKIAFNAVKKSGKKVLVGNNVSKAMNKTKRRFEPNLIKKRFFIPEEDKWITLKVSTSVLKTINKKGISAVLKQSKINKL